MIHAAPDTLKAVQAADRQAVSAICLPCVASKRGIRCRHIFQFCTSAARMSERFGAAPLGKYNGNPTCVTLPQTVSVHRLPAPAQQVVQRAHQRLAHADRAMKTAIKLPGR